MTETSLSARERPGAGFSACSRRDSAVWCCPVLAAYGESHHRRLTLSPWVSSTPVFLGIVYPCLSGENMFNYMVLLLLCAWKCRCCSHASKTY